MKTMNAIIRALNIYEVHGRVTAREMEIDRIAIYVDGDLFGIWDAEKNTFVA